MFRSATCAAALLTALPALAEVPRVVTDIPPVHSLAQQVLGDLGAAELLLSAGGNAHDYQLRPSQARAVADADLVFWVGPEMTPWLARTLDGIGGEARAIALMEVEGTFLRDFGATGGHDHDAHADGADHGAGDHGDDEEGHEDHAGEAHAEAHDGHAGEGHAEAHDDHGHAGAEAGHDGDHAGHDHSGTDPHAWLDPANARAWLGVIAAELAAADPANAATYAANAGAAAATLAALDAKTAARLAPLRGRPFVVFHDAYGYFADHYGLAVAGSVALGDAAAPGAGRLADLRAELAEGGVVCAFPEAQHDPALIATVTEGTGVRVGGTLDPSGSTLEPGPGLYAALLTGMADTLAGCLAE